ncbi:DUF1292 domain-containing protein [Clostridium cylindrosporum]|uniref:DUF1292 domain-containing protein n=1 Tax=Clostridium cylindrosporum DSM 605 TaxID=1121307 RepID=A0A0J8D9H1_CLOCY|nr:DUF1292 domain-containing protein [Clostridium cylindrosporum]KMT20969.1 hypothetical protein CLCY_1c02030 [Clostridium cylindrosporum DSM 605]
MKGKVYSFRNEHGELVKFTAKEFLTLNGSDYVLMSPEDNTSEIDVYKFSIVNGGEALELIDNEDELTKIKEVSKVI